MTVLKVLAFAGGATLVVMVVLSALRTVVLSRAAVDPISRVVFRVNYRLFRGVAGRLRSFESRDSVMALFAPVSLLTLPVAWLAVILFAYMGMFWALGIDGWGRTFEVSGSSLLTLGFAPVDTLPQTALAFTEAVFGLGMLALLIAYLPSIYSAFSRREAGVALLEVRAGSPPSGVEMIIRLHTIGRLDRVDDLWRSWEEWFVDVEESHTSLGALVFLRSPQTERSWVTAAGAALDGMALIVSTVDLPPNPQGHVALRSGYIARRRVADFFGIDYDPHPQQGDPISISRQEYTDACGRMAAAGVPLNSDLDQAWLDFAGWRVNHDTPLLGLCALTMAPEAPWSSDRHGADWRQLTMTRRWGRQLRRRHSSR